MFKIKLANIIYISELTTSSQPRLFLLKYKYSIDIFISSAGIMFGFIFARLNYRQADTGTDETMVNLNKSL